jgi:2-iminobutanoate/2-iminopropanoate deaminase
VVSTAKTVYTPEAPKPIGPYSQAVAAGNFVFCSGQLGLDPIGGELVGETAAEQAERAILNLKAVLVRAGSELSHVIKVTLYLKDMNDFAEVNEVYGRHFIEMKPARTTVAVSQLPKGALVELDAIAEVG